jgi:hypothetical protein
MLAGSTSSVIALSQRSGARRPAPTVHHGDLRRAAARTRRPTRVMRARHGRLRYERGRSASDRPTHVPVRPLADRRQARPHDEVGHALASANRCRYVRLRLRARDGPTRASPNHPFYRLDGWTRLDVLRSRCRIRGPARAPASARTASACVAEEHGYVGISYLLRLRAADPRRPARCCCASGSSAASANGGAVAAYLEGTDRACRARESATRPTADRSLTEDRHSISTRGAVREGARVRRAPRRRPHQHRPPAGRGLGRHPRCQAATAPGRTCPRRRVAPATTTGTSGSVARRAGCSPS